MAKNRSQEDETLDALLCLNGRSFEFKDGYWVKFDVWEDFFKEVDQMLEKSEEGK